MYTGVKMGRLHGSFAIAWDQGIISKLVVVRKDIDGKDVTKKELSWLGGRRKGEGVFELLEMLDVKIKNFALKVKLTTWGKTWKTFNGSSLTRVIKCPNLPSTEKVL